MGKQNRRNDSERGFTLVELSVVLAIIGVLVGGVLAGQYLIRQSQLQGVVSDLTKYRAAYYAFKDQYNGMPGDIIDATDYWGADPNGCPTNAVYTPRKETCNGDGSNTVTGTEEFRFWQQLSDAGLIEGTFTGVAGAGGATEFVPGQNGPGGKIPNSVFGAGTFGPTSGAANFFDISNAEVTIAFALKTSGSWPSTPTLTAREQYGIDAKMDDGLPALGKMAALKSPLNNGCTTADTSTSSYKLTTPGNSCSILYMIDP